MVKSIIAGSLFFLLAFSAQAKTLNVTLDQAKLLVLPKTAKSIFIASDRVADYQTLTNTKIMIFGKRVGSTSLYVLDARENVIYSATVKVNHNVQELNALIKHEFPNAQVHSESTAGKLFLKGQVSTPSIAEKIVRLAEGYVSSNGGKSESAGAATEGGAQDDQQGGESAQSTQNTQELINQLVITMPTQVNLRVRIAEVSRNVSNKLGIKWGAQNIGTISGTFGTKNWLPNVKFPDLSIMIDALASNGLISILAEPNLTAISGERASFLVGGEIPLPVVFGDSANIIYKPFGVRLDFKPTVLSANRIRLQIEPEVSTIAPRTNVQIGGSSLPVFITRKASTTIELASGQSFAIGGLLQSKDIEQLQKIPLLGDIPILGALFRSSEFQREETELIIIATVYLVQPTRSDKFSLPTDGLLPLSDIERLLAWPHKKVTPTTMGSFSSTPSQPRLLGDNGFYY
ncbi:Flp pilus assembly protein CpaC [Psychromonas sp. CNPT3]|uniref:type II and III secretion system protein family protein n=1 Tax=Psychromonas sp. CNPT3 TaxID=314282 RepID=UPI00006E70B4|nr:type II and III secretion system protein family protein [Psychromonas sp. CNPT3]AGH80115.1 Flp pilus assembly protein CpaC [Psychromonas sp. CNPT3]